MLSPNDDGVLSPSSRASSLWIVYVCGVPRGTYTNEDAGKKLKLAYHVDPLLMGAAPAHHLTIEPDDKDALLHALEVRMQRAQRHHEHDRARNRYRVALTFLGAMGLAAGGGALLALVRR